MADKENSAILKGGAVTFKPKKLSYAYDANGNIETIRKNGVLQETYHYDVLNQLVRADSAAQNKSFVYAYDAGGNILSVKEYAYTTGALGTAVKTVNYGYTDGTWKDLLTSYAGQTITYDGIGNPLSYRDGLSMTWRNGRELASLTKNGVTASYLYDESGLRTKKTVGGVVTNYHVINGVLYGEYTGSHRLLYMFDEAGTRYSFLYNGSTYYYVFNGQGDVIGITDGTGNMLARYTYDAWGKPLTITDGAGADVSGNASHIANVNPFRYRGYYYDKESGLYYLQSRYYDPVVGRFINADGITDGGAKLVGNNLFVYGANNPINNVDPTGNWIIKSAIKWLAKNVVKPLVKTVQNVLSKTSGTFSQGVSVSGNTGIWSGGAQIGITVDTKGNIALQGSVSGGASSAGSLGCSVTKYRTVTNAPTTKKLEKEGANIGLSGGGNAAGLPINIGQELNLIPDADLNKAYFGFTQSTGFGTAGFEGHAEYSYTQTFMEFNLYDLGKLLYVKIMEW